MTDFRDMSDEDLLNMAPPEESIPSGSEPEEETPAETVESSQESEVPETQSVETEPASTEEEGDKPSDEGNEAGEESQSSPKEEPNYKEFYEQIMAPFKANGTTIQLKDPKEAILLMQKGANYTSKMQELAPQRKILKMLENNKLIDQDKLEFLIELNNKNPEAIKKFIKDNGIDPLDIDTTSEPQYKSGSQRISDAEITFDSYLDGLKTQENGYETISEMAKWDQKSQEILWEHPETMQDIHDQRKSGVYKLISDEVNRQKVLGNISAGTPFLIAYKQVGDMLMAQRAQSQQPIARGSAPKAQPINNDRVRAAAPTRQSPKTAKTYKNPLAMSDADFMKQYGIEE